MKKECIHARHKYFVTNLVSGRYQRLHSSQNGDGEARIATAAAARARDTKGEGENAWRRPEWTPSTAGGQDGGQNESVFFHRKFFLPLFSPALLCAKHVNLVMRVDFYELTIFFIRSEKLGVLAAMYCVYPSCPLTAANVAQVLLTQVNRLQSVFTTLSQP
jgi:hypothetical protein